MSDTKPLYKVSELSNELRRLIEMSYPEIWIEGELSSLSSPASGHLYFSLKDNDAVLRCAMFKNRAGLMKHSPKIGDIVKVRAKLSIYAARGDLQCIVQHMEEGGIGDIQKQFEQLKKNLSDKGLFSTEHKKPIPKFANHIALITSSSGAAIDDILSTLKRRAPFIRISLFPSLVQGESAASSIIKAISLVEEHGMCDVIILSRGGGSAEDLNAFNNEDLAYSIFDCSIPIICGVGHEVDITIADLVADLRAPTPTSAAELISPDINRLEEKIYVNATKLSSSLNRKVNNLSQSVDMSFHRLIHPKDKLIQHRSDLAHQSKVLTQSVLKHIEFMKTGFIQKQLRLLHTNPKINIAQRRKEISQMSKHLHIEKKRNLADITTNLHNLGDQLNMISPLSTLKRGFSITKNKDDVIVRRAIDTKIGDNINVELSNGSLNCEVINKTN